MNIKPARPEDIPTATHEGVMELFGMKLRTYRLDDGRTVIHADDFHAFSWWAWDHLEGWHKMSLGPL